MSCDLAGPFGNLKDLTDGSIVKGQIASAQSKETLKMLLKSLHSGHNTYYTHYYIHSDHGLISCSGYHTGQKIAQHKSRPKTESERRRKSSTGSRISVGK